MERFGFSITWALPLGFLLVHCASVAPRVIPKCENGTMVGDECVPCADDQVAVNGTCRDPEPCELVECDDDNECTQNECTNVAGNAQCDYPAGENGAMCDADGLVGVCFEGVCDADPCAGVDCDDGDDCTDDGVCDLNTGHCPESVLAPVNSTCGNGGLCNGAGHCVECNRSDQCDDGNECTDDLCDTDHGTCSNPAVADPIQCNYEGGVGACESGVCVAPTPACAADPCPEDDDPCTYAPECRAAGGGRTCEEARVPNGTACEPEGLPAGACQEGACTGLCVGVDCSDGNDCTTDPSCDPQYGTCAGGGFEQSGTRCNGNRGYCDGQGECVECADDSHCPDDNNPCTVPSCLEGGVCGHENAAGSCDVDPTIAESCQNGACVNAGLCDPLPSSCIDGDPCTQDDCAPNNGACRNPRWPENHSCGGGKVCDGQGQCVECLQDSDCPDDNNDCTESSCDGGVCGNNGLVGRGRVCNGGNGYCDGSGDCVECTDDAQCPHDNVFCTEPVCLPSGVCSQTPDDGKPCNYQPGIAGSCSGGECVNAELCTPFPQRCVDGDPCTQDLCNELDGSCDNPLEHTGYGCGPNNEYQCDAQGSCVECLDDLECPDDGNSCTARSCEGGQCGSDALPDYTSCDQGVCRQGWCGTLMPCTEKGIREAIKRGGGFTYTFDCAVKTTVTTSGRLTIDKPVTLDGGDKLVIKGGPNKNHQVFLVNTGVVAELRNLEVTGGGGVPDGGGIYNRGTLTLRSAKVSNSHGTLDGGGIYNRGTLNLVKTTVVGNECESDGAGIYNDATGVMHVEQASVVTDNEALNAAGGGIYNAGAMTLDVVTVSENTSARGGGIYNTGTVTTGCSTKDCVKLLNNTAVEVGGGLRNSGGDVALGYAMISGNKATSNASSMGNGAGIFNGGGGTLTLSTSTVDDNTAQRYGGGVYTTATTNILRSTISNNRTVALQGGGVRNYGGTLRIENSTIYGNEAGTEGGGLHNGGGGHATLVFSTFWVNRAGTEATDIRNAASMQLLNNLIGGTCSGDPAAGNSFYNVFSQRSCFNLTSNTGGGSNTETGPTPIEPPGLLASNGGPTLTLLPNDVTPPIDWVFGGGLYCDATAAVDQRGFPRKRGTKCDAGAVERE